MLNSILDIFFPKLCITCFSPLLDLETMICIDCRHELPMTNFHFNESRNIQKILYGRAQIESGTALFYFEKKGFVQQIIHLLKYKNHENIGEFLGKWLGAELKNISNYHDIDVVIPVPLHQKKLKSRGYNQVTKFAQEIAKSLQADYIDDVLIKITNTNSQVFKKRSARWFSKGELFTTQNLQKINQRHILLVDDIITTGATIEACYNELKKANNIKISIATMAVA